MDKFCPACNVKMKEVQTVSHYGSHIFLDQCGKCGGIWFDSFELYEVSPAEATKIDAMDVDKLIKFHVFKQSVLLCPLDKNPLTAFKDKYFPATLKVENCSRCGGFWLNCGEFKEYAKIRTTKKSISSEKKKDKLEEQIQALLQSESGSPLYKTLGKLGSFLSTPLAAHSLEPLPRISHDEKFKSDEQEKKTRVIIDTISGIINILLRLFLR